MQDFQQVPVSDTSEHADQREVRPWRAALALVQTGLLVAAVLVLVAVLTLRVAAAQHTLHQAAATGARPLATGTSFGSQVGAIAPDFYLQTWTWPGAPNAAPQTLHLAALAGKPVVLNFWASWCDPCKEEAPTLEAAWRQVQPQGVVFVGIAIEDNDQDSLHFLQQYGITYWNGPDATGTIAINEGAPGLPVTIFLHRHGTIAARHVGLIDAQTLHAGVQALVDAP